jgi:hypothetical protein
MQTIYTVVARSRVTDSNLARQRNDGQINRLRTTENEDATAARRMHFHVAEVSDAAPAAAAAAPPADGDKHAPRLT